jgi:hypothetical protein
MKTVDRFLFKQETEAYCFHCQKLVRVCINKQKEQIKDKEMITAAIRPSSDLTHTGRKHRMNMEKNSEQNVSELQAMGMSSGTSS